MNALQRLPHTSSPGCLGAFFPVSRLAAGLMAPTAAWVCVAAKLNYDIVSLNGDDKKRS